MTGVTQPGATVLVVDDYHIGAQVISAVLLAEGYDVRTAGNAEEALLDMARQLPHLLIVDVGLPGMNGLEFARRLRRDPTTAHIPILLVTAHRDPVDAGIKDLDSADELLTKPLDARLLTHTVARLLAAR